MNYDERKKYYKAFIDKWGYDTQAMMCIEEMSELTKALCKYDRFGKENSPKEVKENVLEEVADVCNMMDQLIYVFGKDEIEKIRDEKLKRCVERNEIEI